MYQTWPWAGLGASFPPPSQNDHHVLVASSQAPHSPVTDQPMDITHPEPVGTAKEHIGMDTEIASFPKSNTE
jgi:hypothetical protein